MNLNNRNTPPRMGNNDSVLLLFSSDDAATYRDYVRVPPGTEPAAVIVGNAAPYSVYTRTGWRRGGEVQDYAFWGYVSWLAGRATTTSYNGYAVKLISALSDLPVALAAPHVITTVAHGVHNVAALTVATGTCLGRIVEPDACTEVDWFVRSPYDTYRLVATSRVNGIADLVSVCSWHAIEVVNRVGFVHLVPGFVPGSVQEK